MNYQPNTYPVGYPIREQRASSTRPRRRRRQLTEPRVPADNLEAAESADGDSDTDFFDEQLEPQVLSDDPAAAEGRDVTTTLH